MPRGGLAVNLRVNLHKEGDIGSFRCRDFLKGSGRGVDRIDFKVVRYRFGVDKIQGGSGGYACHEGRYLLQGEGGGRREVGGHGWRDGFFSQPLQGAQHERLEGHIAHSRRIVLILPIVAVSRGVGPPGTVFNHPFGREIHIVLRLSRI